MPAVLRAATLTAAAALATATQPAAASRTATTAAATATLSRPAHTAALAALAALASECAASTAVPFAREYGEHAMARLPQPPSLVGSDCLRLCVL